MDQLWRGIRAAKVSVAELTTRNPNVFYELDLAHSLGKPVVYLLDLVILLLLRYAEMSSCDLLDPDQHAAAELARDASRLAQNHEDTVMSHFPPMRVLPAADKAARDPCELTGPHTRRLHL